MKYNIATALAAVLVLSAPAVAQTESDSATKLSQNECTSLWQQAGGDAGPLTEAQAKPYISNFTEANPDGDTTIEQDEWMNACDSGLVSPSSATGASSGDHTPEKEHAPTNRMNKEVPPMTPESDSN